MNIGSSMSMIGEDEQEKKLLGGNIERESFFNQGKYFLFDFDKRTARETMNI